MALKAKTKRRLLGFSAALLLGCILLNVAAYRHASAMMRFATGGSRTHEPEKLSFLQKSKALFCGVTIPRPESRGSPLDLGTNASSLKINCTNGITLGAWYCPAPAGDWLVILFHGYAGEKSSTVPEAKAFLEMGMSVLLVDFRGSGDSSESYTTVGFAEAEDVAAALRYARTNLPHRRIALYGQSMGAAAILCAVHRCAVQPDAIIAEAVFDTLLNTVRNRFQAMGVPSFPSAQLLVFWGGRQARFNGFRHNPVEYASAVRCPILFLHGAADPRARVEEARRVFDAVPAPKHFHEFPRLRHQAILTAYPDVWKKVVREFLCKSPGGTTDNSPPFQFQRWVPNVQAPSLRANPPNHLARNGCSNRLIL
ncbi:MAG: hypothetical protein C5B50_29980 [Verrucomicrobia bacterium]|nr:MAG: hypothetical protein C5B50_29980 [Verrucomicrobiota bacterium]